MTLTGMLAWLSVVVAACGLLYAFLVVNQAGFLNTVEHVGLTLVAWARSQRWAQDVRRAEYEALALTAQPRPAELARIAGQ